MENLSQTQKNLVLSLHRKFDYLAGIYSSKVSSLDNIGFTREDVKQELSIKIFEVIVNYVHQTFIDKNKRPMNLLQYISSSCQMRLIDLIRSNTKPQKRQADIVDVCEYDFAIQTEFEGETKLEIDNVFEAKFIINDIDLCQGLTKDERQVMNMYLFGYKEKEIKELFPKINLFKIVKKQRQFWAQKEEELKSFRHINETVLISSTLED